MNKVMDELRTIVMGAGNVWTDSGIPRVSMIKAEACATQVYEPMLHLVLQGSKILSIGNKILEYKTASYFVVPVDVPATGEVHASGPDLPYMAISLSLDPSVIATLLEGDREGADVTKANCFSPMPAPVEMLDAWLRLMRLIDSPNEAAILAPMIEREILFRVLQGPYGEILREIAYPDGRLAQIRRATYWIREHYTEPFRIESLAELTNMSVATFYRHFKSITAMTPIQYQKRLRLIKARWLLLFDARDVTSIAFTVGYESASQFNREYSRMFGMPPARDAARFKTPTGSMATRSGADV